MQRIPAKLSPIWLLPLLVHYLVHTKSLLCVGGEWRDGIAVPLILCFYVQPTEDPETFLNRRPLTTPLVLVDENQDAFLCIGTEAIPFPKRYLRRSIVYNCILLCITYDLPQMCGLCSFHSTNRGPGGLYP